MEVKNYLSLTDSGPQVVGGAAYWNWRWGMATRKHLL